MLALSWIVVAAAGNWTLNATDGAALGAEDWGAGPSGVLLLHDRGRSRADFSSLGPRLAASGHHALALEVRPAEDGLLLAADGAQAIAWLRERGASSVTLVGVGVGANVALLLAAEDAAVARVVAIAPTLSGAGLKLSASAPRLGARPLLVVSGEDDPLSLRASAYLAGQATDGDALKVDGPAVHALSTAPDLESAVLGWLAVPPPGDGALNRDGSLRSGELGAVPTSGTRFEERRR